MRTGKTENQVCITVNPKVYALEAIYGAAYVFLDRAYVFLDQLRNGNISITLRGKERVTSRQLDAMRGEFSNALLNYSLRNEIAKNNKKIREYILARALIGVLPGSEEPEPPTEEMQEWKGDDLGIAVSWEKKFAKKPRAKKSRA